MLSSELAHQLQCVEERSGVVLEITGIASLADAGPQQLAPYSDVKYRDQFKTTHAGAILCKTGTNLEDAPSHAAIFSCADPEMTFLKAIRMFNPARHYAPGIHPTAIIESGVEIGEGAHIGPRVFIEAGTRIGARCTILSNTAIGRDCQFGDDCMIHSNVTVLQSVKMGHRVTLRAGAVVGNDGFGYKFRGGKHIKVPQVGWVEIGDDVEVGANSCIDRGTLGATRIGSGTKIDNLVQIAHNNDVGKHCILCGQVAIAGSCKLGDYVLLGGQVGLADFSQLGQGAQVGAGSMVAGTIPAGQAVWGPLAREARAGIRAFAALIQLPNLLKRVKALEKKVGE
ncbi:MAG: UDP-3-O-(3-hydroxymyristoyl)glucosamine N-acyltransferase [Planctomycetota bacterium]